MSELTRREFVKSAAAVAVALQTPALFCSLGAANDPAPIVPLHWLGDKQPALGIGTAWGVPWPQGAVKTAEFALRSADGKSVPVQSWPLARWPDGSIKWSGHALAPADQRHERFTLAPGTPAAPQNPVTVTETAETLEIDTGILHCRVPLRGPVLIASLVRDGRETARDGRLVCLRQAREGDTTRQEKFTGIVEKATLEQRGPVRVVVKLDGRHVSDAGRAWLPFSVRLYFSAGSDAVRIVHSFIFDGDEQSDFIQGLGIRFTVPLADPLYDRHVRFTGEGNGLWAEAVRNLTGLRRDPGQAVIQAQLDGRACPPLAEFPDAVGKRLDYIPAWNDFTLFQPSPDSFEVRKRTSARSSWLHADQGRRASGLVSLSGPSGGIALGLRDFWQRPPTQLDIVGAASSAAEVTAWLWGPDAPPMDLRYYDTKENLQSNEQQMEGLEIIYEDYEKGFATPMGVARTSELVVWALATTPSRERLVEMAATLQSPPVLASTPQYYHATRIFGGIWSLPDRSTPARSAIEDRLDWLYAYYRQQIEERRWYGFWDYGDVMHTYDADRHVWRYDVGGYAWANSELSPDLWLWYAYLRSGRLDIFRTAEAMTRHTSEVDVHHLGRFAGLGSRHNVMHWGDSAKQLRISTAIYRRFYYYLTSDERMGDLLHELADADAKLAEIDPLRKRVARVDDDPARVNFGTDWASAAGNWLTEWERTGNVKYRDKILVGMRSIGGMRNGFFTGVGGFDPATGAISDDSRGAISVSHLNAVFGAVEILAELRELVDQPEFFEAWLKYCELYNADAATQRRVLGQSLDKAKLRQAHSRLTAYASRERKSDELAKRAWAEFFEGGQSLKTFHIAGPAVLNPVDEAAWVSTNDASQWCLAAIENLELASKALTEQ